MAEKTGIAWCDHTFNPWIGCTKVSDGCKHCYAETQNKRYRWVDAWGPIGTRRRTSAKLWKDVEKWNREAWVECEMCGWRGDESEIHPCKFLASSLKPTRQRVFVGSLMDVLEKRDELIPWRNDLVTLVEKCTNMDFLFLTKRPELEVELLPYAWHYIEWPSHVWMGTSVENQEQVKRIIPLLETPAPVTFVSVEPMLGPVNLGFPAYANARDTWVICGGESGAGCRPMNIEWARDLRERCKAANVPFFMKQLGGHPNKRHDLADFPDDLRIREFPEGAMR